MSTTEELSQISMLDIAHKLGMELKRASSENYTWVEHPSFVINTRKNIFSWFSRDIHGSTIKLVQTIREAQTGEKVPFKAAKRFLEQGKFEAFTPSTKPAPVFRYYLKRFEEPFQEARDYLANERGLSNETIDFFGQQGGLVQAQHKTGNYQEPIIVFKFLDAQNKVVGASLQGIRENKTVHERGRLKRLMRASDGSYGFHVDIGQPKRLVFAEAPIDLMSYYELHKDSLKDVRLVAMDGLKSGTISHYLAQLIHETAGLSPYQKDENTADFLATLAKTTKFFENDKNADIITLAVDNDEAARQFVDKIKALGVALKADLPPLGEGQAKMDWNDYLKITKGQEKHLTAYQTTLDSSKDLEAAYTSLDVLLQLDSPAYDYLRAEAATPEEIRQLILTYNPDEALGDFPVSQDDVAAVLTDMRNQKGEKPMPEETHTRDIVTNQQQAAAFVLQVRFLGQSGQYPINELPWKPGDLIEYKDFSRAVMKANYNLQEEHQVLLKATGYASDYLPYRNVSFDLVDKAGQVIQGNMNFMIGQETGGIYEHLDTELPAPVKERVLDVDLGHDAEFGQAFVDQKLTRQEVQREHLKEFLKTVVPEVKHTYKFDYATEYSSYSVGSFELATCHAEEYLTKEDIINQVLRNVENKVWSINYLINGLGYNPNVDISVYRDSYKNMDVINQRAMAVNQKEFLAKYSPEQIANVLDAHINGNVGKPFSIYVDSNPANAWLFKAEDFYKAFINPEGHIIDNESDYQAYIGEIETFARENGYLNPDLIVRAEKPIDLLNAKQREFLERYGTKKICDVIAEAKKKPELSLPSGDDLTWEKIYDELVPGGYKPESSSYGIDRQIERLWDVTETYGIYPPDVLSGFYLGTETPERDLEAAQKPQQSILRNLADRAGQFFRIFGQKPQEETSTIIYSATDQEPSPQPAAEPSSEPENSVEKEPVSEVEKPDVKETRSVSEIIAAKDTKALSQVMKDGIKNYFNSDTYKAFLVAMSKLNQYSPRNLQLLMAQNPDVTKVASFKTWKNEFGRSVNKGAKSLKVWAPYQIQLKDEKTGEPILDDQGNAKTVTRFRLVPVFDVSQTNGKELPKAVYNLEGTHKDYEDLYRAAKQVAQDKGVRIEIDRTPALDGANGYYEPGQNKIVLMAGMSEQATLNTLFHELAHADLHNPNAPAETRDTSLTNQELQAESVAFVVANHFGLDTSSASFGYLAGWSQDPIGLQDLQAQLTIVQKSANGLIQKLDASLEKVKSKELNIGKFEQKLNRFKDLSKEQAPQKAAEEKETPKKDQAGPSLGALAQ